MVRVNAPVIVALVAVKAPARETLNGAEPKVLSPRCIPLAVDKDILEVPVPAINELEPTVKPPIAPVVAFICPSKTKVVPFQYSLSLSEKLPLLSK